MSTESAQTGTYQDMNMFSSEILVWIHRFLFTLTAGTQLFLIVADTAETPLYYWLLTVILFFLAAAYLLNRRGYFLISAYLTVSAAVAGPWLSLVFDPAVIAGDFFPLIYVSVSIFLSSLLLSLTVTMVLALVQFAALIIILIVSPATTELNWASFIIYFFFIASLGIISSYKTKQILSHLFRQREVLAEKSLQLQEQTIRDHLTGLFNRRYFEATMDHEIRRAAGQHIPIGLILMDIDNFKEYNDRFGHSVGDRLLKEFSDFLCESIRITNIVCRYGGDEFVIVFPDTTLEEIRPVAERLRQKVREIEVGESDEKGTVTISQGIALYPYHGANRLEVVSAADKALYRAKDEGRNRIVVT